MTQPTVHSAQETAALVEQWGFLPFFRNNVTGFSLAECTPPELWFVKDREGPWEWKGPVLRQTGGVYGKFFASKVGYVSRAWFADFANYRRDGYDFEGYYNDGLASFKDKAVYDVLEREGNLLARALKTRCGRPKGYEGSLTRLQMKTFVVTSGFEYAVDRYGREYGWGLARLATPEDYFGQAWMDEIYRRTPAESYERIYAHLRGLFPQAEDRALRALIG